MSATPKSGQVGGIAVEQLRSYVNRILNLDEEIKERNDDKSEVFKQAAGEGFDRKTIKKVAALAKADPSKLAEEEMLLDLYRDAYFGARSDEQEAA